jgi:cullin-4
VDRREPKHTEDLQDVLEDITPILKGEPTKKSYHHLSAACHRLVQLPHDKGAEIHARIESELGTSVATMTRSWRGAIMAREPGFLDRFITEWRAWEKRVVSPDQMRLSL